MTRKIVKGLSFVFVLLSITACSLFNLEEKSSSATVSGLAFSKTTLSLGIGNMEYLKLSIQPAEAKGNSIEYSYDSSVITVSADNSGASVLGVKSGNTVLLAKANGVSCACVVTVSGVDPAIENTPYITTTSPIVELESGTSKKIMISLSKGSSNDMSRFIWSIDKSNIATIESSGQNAIIHAKTNGIARITITHPLSTYPLEILVFVKPENEKAVYLTTTQNIISLPIDTIERKITVTLIGNTTTNQTGFSWEVLDSSESNPNTIKLLSNENNATITPLADGYATIRVHHPSALYPLDIKVRVITIVENVYIDTDTKVTVNGEAPSSLSVSLKGTNNANTLDPSLFQWTIDDASICEFTAFQNEIVLKGKKNGMAKVMVSHPAAKYPREILVFVEGQPDGAINSGAYITTSQNYIRLKPGMNEEELLVSLLGGDQGDEKDFVWAIDDPSIISMRTTNGHITSRSIFSKPRIDGKAYIEAKKEGVAVIYVSHPKILTPTEILVKVYPEYVNFEKPLVINGESIINLLRLDTRPCKVNLENASSGDEASLVWTSENTNIVTLSGSGNEYLLTPTGNGQTFITVNHPKAEHPKKILVNIAETQAELDALKSLYSSKTYYNIVAGKEELVFLNARNIDVSDYSQITWSSSNNSVATVIVGENNTIGIIKGISSGTATITAQFPSVLPVNFNVTVYPSGTDLGVLPPSVYFTTDQNVVQFSSINSDKTVMVTPINLPLADYSQITWTSNNPDIATVIPNGNKATITAIKEGEAKITVTHPKSENNLTITVRIGSEYIITNPKDPFITTTKDVLGLVKGAQGEQITAKLENKQGNQLFTWEIQDSEIATINPLGDKCFIIPKKAGQTSLIIRHAEATYDKKVLILVANTEEELKGLAYLTTTQNVIRMVTNTQQTLSVRVSGDDKASPNSYSWNIDNPSIGYLIDNGSNAVVTASKAGVARITITHPSCLYPLEVILIVSDTLIDASMNPYITTNQNIVTITKGGSSKNLQLTLVGGEETDNQFFSWTVDRGDLLSLTHNGNNALVKGLKVGEAQITVRNPKAQYPLQIIIIVEDSPPNATLYINPSVSIVSMKPADPTQTITATLVGGNPEDKYGFKWSADNYNVIDLTYSANTGIIKPRQEGKALITISHPKSAYECTVVVNVTEYSQFSFSQNSMTIPEGTTQFLAMQVPAMEGEYNGRVTYQTDNPAIVSISGTNKVAQLTALKSGTAVVSAISPSGSRSELMVYVQKAAEITAPYITSASNVLSMKMTDSQRSLSASIVGQGITTPDQYNLQWAVTDPSIVGLIGTSGTNILVKPLKAGETTIKVTHPKTDSIYSIFVQVEGSVSGISINKNYVALETGKTQEISALIDNGTTENYKNINWSVDKVNGEEIINILGSGKTVALYALKAGQTTVTAEFNGKTAKCDVKVAAARQFMFDTQTMRLQPGQTKTFNYVLSPEDTSINWFTDSNDYISYTVDPIAKKVSITGISEGNSQSITKLSGIANSMSASISIICTWDYNLDLKTTIITGEPKADPNMPDKFIIPYTVNPSNAVITVDLTNDTIASYDVKSDRIILTPLGEGAGQVIVTAKNPYNNYSFATKTCQLNFTYNKLTVKPSKINQIGKYSRYIDSTNQLILGDGEEFLFGLSVVEPNVNYTLSGVTFTASSGSPPITLTSPSEGVYSIKHTVDSIEYVYKVTHDCYYEIDGERAMQSWQYANAETTDEKGANCYEGYNYLRIKSIVNSSHSASALLYPGNNTYSLLNYGVPTIQFKSIPLSTPLYISEAEFKANRNYYLPSQDRKTWRNEYWDLGGRHPTSYNDFTTLEYFINNATRMINPDESVKSFVTVGYITGSINRTGGAPIPIKIPVMVETRNNACK